MHARLRESLDTSSPTWLSGKALQVFGGGFVLLGLHGETVLFEMSIPSFKSSPCTRGAPHGTLAFAEQGKKRLYRMEPAALQFADSWLQPCRRFWQESLLHLKAPVESRPAAAGKRHSK